MSDDRDIILLRIGEIFLKGRNRPQFFARFLKNARRLVADLDGVSVEGQHLRALVRHPPALRQACVDRLARLFGLQSMSPAVKAPRDLDGIAAVAVEVARALPPGATFKIESKRRDKQFPITSQELSRQVGGRIVGELGLAVDVHDPDRVIHVEVDADRGYVFGDIIAGPGGLPVGVSGRVSLLLSGGIDSPVAGWSIMRRGCDVSAVYFHAFPYTGDKSKEKVLDLARELARWQGKMAVHVVHFTEVQKALRDRSGELAVLLYRRMMMRAASALAKADGRGALVTGENLGQVASQTLANLGVIEEAASLPVLRPLVAYDKQEIVARARQIGTYETSILPYDDCCALFVPKHPATRARLDDLLRAEDGLDVDGMAAQLAADAEKIVVG